MSHRQKKSCVIKDSVVYDEMAVRRETLRELNGRSRAEWVEDAASSYVTVLACSTSTTHIDGMRLPAGGSGRRAMKTCADSQRHRHLTGIYQTSVPSGTDAMAGDRHHHRSASTSRSTMFFADVAGIYSSAETPSSGERGGNHENPGSFWQEARWCVQQFGVDLDSHRCGGSYEQRSAQRQAWVESNVLTRAGQIPYRQYTGRTQGLERLVRLELQHCLQFLTLALAPQA